LDVGFNDQKETHCNVGGMRKCDFLVTIFHGIAMSKAFDYI